MILLVGGAGYIGAHTNKILNRRRYETVVIDNLASGHRELVRWGSLEIGDLKDLHWLRYIFNKYRVTAVIHLAGCAYVNESVVDPQKYYLNNVVNGLNLLQVMLEYDVNKIVFSSSCATYGIPLQTPIVETHPQNPITAYGRTKFMLETILHDYSNAYGMTNVILRYFNAAGADQDAEIGEWHEPETHLIPLLLDVALGKSSLINIYGADYNTPDGTCVRDYVHVADLAMAHVLALEYLLDGGTSDCFNLGAGVGNSVKTVMEAVEAVTGCKISYVENKRREGDPPFLVCDPSKAMKVLGWQPTMSSLTDIISTAWAWHMKPKIGASLSGQEIK